MSEVKNFFIVGAMKSGTTSLHHLLSSHPNICMSNKGLEYFNQNFEKGIDWYIKQFRKKVKYFGEATPNYSKFHVWSATAANIYNSFPDSKIIYIVRDPIDRIISHLHHDLYRDRIYVKDIDKEVLSSQNYLLTSSYYYQISKFLEYFDRKSILILPFELLRDKPQDFINNVMMFLDLPNYSLQGSPKFYASETRYLIKWFDFAKKIFPAKIRRFYFLFFYLLNIKLPKPKLSESTVKVLREKLKPDVERLKTHCSYEFSEWKNFHSMI